MVEESFQLTSLVAAAGSLWPQSAGLRFKSAPQSSQVTAPITPPSASG